VQLWWSFDSKPLIKIGTARSVSSFTSGDEFHLGILRLPLNNNQDPTPTHVIYSNVVVTDSVSEIPSSATGTGSPTSVTTSPTQQTTQKPTTGPVQTPSPTTAQTKQPTRSPTKTPTSQSGSCSNPTWSTCGGVGFSGSTCCKTGDVCTFINNYYSQCVPGSASASKPCTNQRYAQCGGKSFTGETCCQATDTCVKVNDYYSQCNAINAAEQVHIESTNAYNPTHLTVWITAGVFACLMMLSGATVLIFKRNSSTRSNELHVRMESLLSQE
jgi:hypothetical protein